MPDNAARDSGLDEEELVEKYGGKMPWDHHLDSAQFLEPRAPDVITREWLSPVQRPRLGIGGKHTRDFDKLDTKWLQKIEAPKNDEELLELRLERQRQAKAAYAWGHEDAVMCCEFSPDGVHVASGGCDGRLCIWEYESGTCLRNLTHHEVWVMSVCWSEDGSLLASAAADNVVRIWRTDDWIKIKELMNVHTNWVTSVKFLPRALEVDLLEQELHSRLLSASADRTIVVWGLGSSDWPMLRGRGHGSWINDVIVREDGIIATGSSDTKVRLWRLRKVNSANGETKENNKTRRKAPPGLVLDSLTELSTPAWVTSLCWMDDDRLVAACKANCLCIWRVGDNLDGENVMLTKVSNAHEMDCVNAVAFSPHDGGRLMSAAEDKVVSFYHPKKMAVKRLGNGRAQRLVGHPGPIYGLSFSPDGTMIASCAEDCSIRVWKCASRVALRKFEHRQDDSWKKML